MLRTTVKAFQELSLVELYNILQLRSEVFVVEQNCVYQDLDGKDKNAYHVLGNENGELVAYTRFFAPGDYFDEAAIGRVVVKENKRALGYGNVIMQASNKAVYTLFGGTAIKISAQYHLLHFYKQLGFEPIGEQYLEDGIPHTAMIKKYGF